MKFFPVLMSLILYSNSGFGQGFHLDFFGGVSNYQGDLQRRFITFNQAHLAAGVGFSYDITSHFSVRTGVTFAKVSGADKYTPNKNRNLSFTSGISEGKLDAVYNIFPVGYHSITPYVFGGVAVFHFDPFTFDSTSAKYYLKPFSTEGEGFIEGKNEYNLTQISIPFGAGVKLSLTDNVNVGIEIGLRKTFTDYLDDVSSVYVDRTLLLTNRGAKAVELAYRGDELKDGNLPYPPAGTKRGASAQKDWYYFTGITLSFRLGGGGLGKELDEYRCPPDVH